jgi:multiple antibiotic resistance protein
MELDLALTDFVEPFLSLFVAMNAIGVLPLFIGMTEGMTVKHRRSLVRRAIATALAIALVIVLAGRVIFDTLGITVNDLRIGGGLILLVLSITDLLFSNLTRKTQSNGGADAAEDLGVVPLGTPLTVGPAAITTILVLQEGYGYLPTVVALIANLIPDRQLHAVLLRSGGDFVHRRRRVPRHREGRKPLPRGYRHCDDPDRHRWHCERAVGVGGSAREASCRRLQHGNARASTARVNRYSIIDLHNSTPVACL